MAGSHDKYRFLTRIPGVPSGTLSLMVPVIKYMSEFLGRPEKT